jgi:hypothetical protein
VIEPAAEDDAIARAVLDAAIAVHRALGPGLLEGVHELLTGTARPAVDGELLDSPAARPALTPAGAIPGTRLAAIKRFPRPSTVPATPSTLDPSVLPVATALAE